MKFTKYSELISHMLVSEKHQLLLLRNSKSRPPGTVPPPTTPKINYTSQFQTFGCGRGRFYRGGRGSSRGRGYRPQRGGRSSYRGLGRGSNSRYMSSGNRDNNQKYQRSPSANNNIKEKSEQPPISNCCGTKGHLKKTCQIPLHLATLYKHSLQKDDFESHGAFLDVPALQPVIHMNSVSDNTNTPDIQDSCIIDGGTSHTI
jgi:hypothetical protein